MESCEGLHLRWSDRKSSQARSENRFAVSGPNVKLGFGGEFTFEGERIAKETEDGISSCL